MISRAVANKILYQVIHDHWSLNHTFEKSLPKHIEPLDKSFIKECCFGVLRWYHQLSPIKSSLLLSPLRKKDTDIDILIMLGLFQILHSNVPDHAAVSETVSVCKKIRKGWATNLVNKCLRRFIEEQQSLLDSINSLEFRFSHPKWMIEKFKKAWPDRWQEILEENNVKPPLWLRINTQKTSVDDYLKLLEENGTPAQAYKELSSAILLETPTPIQDIPHFSDGFASIQDLAGQFAAHLLDTKEGHKVLDACAAPGSKTCHLLELNPSINLTAIESDQSRFSLIEENMDRLCLDKSKVKLIHDDASNTESWWDGELFDRILLDVPCSSTGVIRRHPDIKLLRKEKDIEANAALQQQLLRKMWGLLKPNGKLLYSTCSLLPKENEEIISEFLRYEETASAEKLSLPIGSNLECGVQIFPETFGPDGFYYALLSKK